MLSCRIDTKLLYALQRFVIFNSQLLLFSFSLFLRKREFSSDFLRLIQAIAERMLRHQKSMQVALDG